MHYPIKLARRPVAESESVRIVLEPTKNSDSFSLVGDWVRDGGILVLADSSTNFASEIGVNLEQDSPAETTGAKPKDPVKPTKSKARPRSFAIQSPDVGTIDVSQSKINGVITLAVGNDRLTRKGETGRVLVASPQGPVVTTHPRGKGEIWIIHYPTLFENSLLKRQDNAVLLCRLATLALSARPGTIAFDDYFHGLGDRPGVIELLFTPPMIWLTLQALLLTAIVVWKHSIRFGAVRSSAPPPRRSKEEFLDALAGLLESRRDYGDAYRTVRDDLKREIAVRTGLPPSAPPALLAEAAGRRFSVDSVRLLPLLEADRPPSGNNASAFLHDMNALESFQNA